jgi:hypothetical protein
MLPAFYKTSEIAPRAFVPCLKEVYGVLEKKNKGKSEPDPFIQAAIGMDLWNSMEKGRQWQKALEGKVGDMHEELLGKLPGCETLIKGHDTGCDVLCEPKNTIVEVKNKFNTMNSSSAEAVITKLEKQAHLGRRAILAEIICPKGKVRRHKAPPSVEVMNGQQIYALLSGRETFFDDLLSTVQYIFANFKTYEELKAALEIP